MPYQGGAAQTATFPLSPVYNRMGEALSPYSLCRGGAVQTATFPLSPVYIKMAGA